MIEDPDFDLEAMKAAVQESLRQAEEAEPPPRRMVSGAYVYPDGTLHTRVIVEADIIPPEGFLFVEGEFDLKTDKLDMSTPVTVATSDGPIPPGTYPVVPQTEMDLSYPATVPADGTTVATVTGIPPRTLFYTLGSDGIGRELTQIDDGVLELTFDTVDSYTFTFQHQGWLDTTITIEAVATS